MVRSFSACIAIQSNQSSQNPIVYSRRLRCLNEQFGNGLQVMDSLDELISLEVEENSVIFIDPSLDVAIEGGRQLVEWILKSRRTAGVQITVMLIPSILIGSRIVAELEYLADCCCRVHNLQRYIDGKHDFKFIHHHSSRSYEKALVGTDDNNPGEFLMDSMVKKASGKYFKEEAVISVQPDDWSLISAKTLDEHLAMLSGNEEQRQPQHQPKHEVSFNIHLTQDQEKSRSKVDLPFMTAQKQQHSQPQSMIVTPTVHSSTSPGIFYSMEDADDFDDEDPDADLEI